MAGNSKHLPTMEEMQDILNVVSIAAAAKLWGFHYSTIQYQIDKGRLAAKQDCVGRWHVSIGSLVQLWGAPMEAETYDLSGNTFRVQ
jgi:hypothetical protein